MSFHFKSFEEMTPDDYAAIGFKCGLEVHQQILTDRKLFCRCPAGRYSGEYDAEVLRHMRPTLSELGEYDGTALMEKKTKKNIYYRLHRDTVCTYEFDDTPPFFPDPRAIDIALEMSLLLDLNMVGEMHIARKQYLDGSIPTGFQRTAILGISGSIPYQGRRIGIRQLSLEEDSCREVSDIGHDRVYLTDRLGMPLIEVVTEPDMQTPWEIAEVCQIIRLLCRSTHKVRTGYGATRQDVNVSVAGGTRIEIKGVPRIPRIPLLVYNEARRQCSLLHIREELRRRGITKEAIRWTAHDVTRAIAKSHYRPVREALAQGRRVRCVVLRGFAGLLKQETQEHTTFAKEFSDRVRVIACMTDLPNTVHSDTASDLLSARDWKELRSRTRAEERDALILVWGGEDDTRTACEEIGLRATEATQGVPSDTRQALKDGTNGFERVLPGAERMYPDTDLPPMVIEASRLDGIRCKLPERVWDRLARYEHMRLPADVVEPLGISRRANLFDRIVDELDVDPVFVGVIVVQRFKALRRSGLEPDLMTDEEIYEVFRAHAEKALAREGVLEVIAGVLRDRCGSEVMMTPVGTAIQAASARHVAEEGLDRLIGEAIAGVDPARFATIAKKHRYLVGRLMKPLLGGVEGAIVVQRLAAALGDGREDLAPEEVEA